MLQKLFLTCFLVALLTGVSNTVCHAAYLPGKQHSGSIAVGAHTPATVTSLDDNNTAVAAQPVKPFINPDDNYSSTIEGTLSLVCAGFAILSFIALSVTSFSFFIIPAIAFSVMGIIFGAVGLKHHRKGNAITGMILGLIGLVGSFVAMAAL